MKPRIVFQLLAIGIAIGGCGREDFIPSVPGDFEPRNTEEEVVVVELDAEDVKAYQRIGTAHVKAKKDLNALSGCRAVAAEHGGDAIHPPEKKEEKEWKCFVLRRKKKYVE